MKAIPRGWQVRTLAECGKWLSGGTPNRSIREYWNGDIPWISAKTLTSIFVSSSDRNVSMLGAHNGTRLVPSNTLLFVVRGMSLKSEFRLGLTTREVTFNQDLKAILPNNDLDPRFLLYSLQAREHAILGMVDSAAHGTGKLPTDRIAGLSIGVPRIDVQHRIADILSAYDDLIENNNRRMALLEEAIHLLYREWFVYLRFPGHERVKVVDGVPEGWRRGTASDCLNVLSGGTPKTKVEGYWDGDIPFFTPKDVPQGVFVWDTEKHLSEEGLRNCNSRLFPRETLFITARGTVGKLALAQREMAMNQSCYALEPRSPYSTYFLFCAMQEVVRLLKKAATGGVFDTIIVKTFDRTPMLIVPPKLAEQFSGVVRPLFCQLDALTLMNRKLREARDLLLPRLMNGSMAV